MRVVQLPRKIEVGSYEFPIQIVPANDRRLDDADGITYMGAEGELVPAHAIFIAARMGPKRTLDRVMHEVTHAINFVYDIDEGKAKILEETVADKHGAAWAQFWIDNPKMLRWLTYVVERIHKEREGG